MMDENVETSKAHTDEEDVVASLPSAPPTRLSDMTSAERSGSHLVSQYMSKRFSQRLSLAHTESGVDANIFDFSDLTFTVYDKKNKADKDIIKDITARVKSGRTLGMMGPSGAGKTSLIKALTLGAFGGTTRGTVTLNGIPLTDRLFKEHCFLVEQYDKLWPFLTCKETLMYAAQLYASADKPENTERVVDEIITKMGLDSCKDTRAGSMSGGQRRRLSVAVALLKQPTVIFLDEPTSGLDAAAASNVMKEISRITKQEGLIVICTIHQPSYKVYERFDQVMILSKGRVAYVGETGKALDHFETVGYPMKNPENPADFMLDCVNSDFTSSDEVEKILDAWDEKAASNKKAAVKSEGIKSGEFSVGFWTELRVLFRRQTAVIWRDPILYIGRAISFIFANLFFAFVYWEARSRSQAEALNKVWVWAWFVGVPAQMGVVAVYGLNEEFKAIKSEMKNGMVKVSTFALVKSVLVVPIMFLFAVCAMSISGYAIQNYTASTYGIVMVVWAVSIFTFECMAEAMSVLFTNAIFGMLNFIALWFGAFLFGGLMLPEQDMIWPFRAIFYVMPLGYSFRSLVYITFKDFDWEACKNQPYPVCVDSTDGEDVLDALGEVYPLFSSENTVARDVGIMLAIGCFFKIVYLINLVRKSRQASVVKQPQNQPQEKDISC